MKLPRRGLSYRAELKRELRHKILPSLAFIGCLVPAAVCAAETYFQPSFSAVLPDRNRFEGSDVSFQIVLGQQLTPRIGWFANYMADEFRPREGGGLLRQRAFDLGASFNWGQIGPVTPYSPASLGIVDSSLGSERHRAPSASLGIGYAVQLPWEKFQLTNEFRGRYSRGSVYNNDESVVDALGTVGLRYTFKPDSLVRTRTATAGPFGGPAALAAQSDGSPVVSSNTTYAAPSMPAMFPDADMDRVPDGQDRCPNTVASVKVDVDGCVVQ